MREKTVSRPMSRAVVCAALALAWALAGWPPSLAYAVGEGDYPLEITADAAKEGENVVSVVVPSSVSIMVKTSVVDGRIMGITADAATIKNDRRSFAPISVKVDAFTDTPTKGEKLLSYVDMAFLGDHEVAVVEGEGLNAALFDHIAPDTSSDLEIRLQQHDDAVLVPAGSYALRALLRVEPVELNEGAESKEAAVWHE